MAYRKINAMPGPKARLHTQQCTCTACSTATDPMHHRANAILRMQVAVVAICVTLICAVPALCGVQL